MSLDDFEELLADKPADERWELLGGRVTRMMVTRRSMFFDMPLSEIYALPTVEGQPLRRPSQRFTRAQ
jgi:hypothetical protein